MLSLSKHLPLCEVFDKLRLTVLYYITQFLSY